MALISLKCRWCNEYVDDSKFHRDHGLPGKKFQYTYIQCFDCRDRIIAEKEPVPIKKRFEILDLRGC